MNRKPNIVFGIRVVKELIKARKDIDKIFVNMHTKNDRINEIINISSYYKIPCKRVPIEKINRITKKNHQGVVAYLSSISYASLDYVISSTFEKGKNPLLLILDGITDIRNFGAIARTAEYAGANAIVIPETGSAHIGEDAMKTSSGALGYIPVCREKYLKDVVNRLQDNGLVIFACTEKTKKTIYKSDFSVPTAIILGSEEKGISQDLLQKADYLVSIPMLGNTNSLNVSVATGIVLFEAIRQRIK